MARPPSPARRPDSVRTQERKLDRLAARVGDLEIQMRALIASAGRRGGRRGAKPRKRTLFKNSMTLTEALRKLLKGRTMRVVEAAQAVQKAGWPLIGSTGSPMRELPDRCHGAVPSRHISKDNLVAMGTGS